MQSNIRINRIRIERLAKNQHSFLVFISGGVEERNIGANVQIARNLLPDKLEGVRRGPHILAASCEGVAVLRGVKAGGPRMKHRADVGVTLANPNRLLRV